MGHLTYVFMNSNDSFYIIQTLVSSTFYSNSKILVDINRTHRQAKQLKAIDPWKNPI